MNEAKVAKRIPFKEWRTPEERMEENAQSFFSMQNTLSRIKEYKTNGVNLTPVHDELKTSNEYLNELKIQAILAYFGYKSKIHKKYRRLQEEFFQWKKMSRQVDIAMKEWDSKHE